MTKGARRRNAYVTVVMGSAFFFALVLTGPDNWFINILYIVIGAVTAEATHTLADIGFTKRANNEL